MKIGSIMAFETLIMAVIVISWSVQQGAEAKVYPQTTCYQTENGGAPLSDATTYVQQWVRATSTYCSGNTAPNTCNGLSDTGLDAVIIVCFPANSCMGYSDMGDYVNQILVQCVWPNNVVQGQVQITDSAVMYLNSKECLPNCYPP